MCASTSHCRRVILSRTSALICETVTTVVVLVPFASQTLHWPFGCCPMQLARAGSCRDTARKQEGPRMRFSVHAVRGTVRALAKCSIVRLVLESIFAMFANVVSKCGDLDRPEDGAAASQQWSPAWGRETGGESGSDTRFWNLRGPADACQSARIAPFGSWRSNQRVTMRQNGQINSAGSIPGAMLRQ